MDQMKTQLQLQTIVNVAAQLDKELAEPGKAEILKAKGVVGGLAAAVAMIAQTQDEISRDESIEDKEEAARQIKALGKALKRVQDALEANRIDVVKREAHQEAYAKVRENIAKQHGGVIASAKAAAARQEAREDDPDYEPPARRASTPAPAPTPSTPPAKPKSKVNPGPKIKKG